MYYDIEDLPKTLVVKKSKQNIKLLSQYYDRIMVNASGNRNISIPISSLLNDSSLIGLPELTYLAAALHQENKQNKL